MSPAPTRVPTAARLPLDARSRRGARIAGAVSFLLFTLGFCLLAGGAAALGALAIASSASGVGGDPHGLVAELRYHFGHPSGRVFAGLIAAGVLGVVLLVGAVATSVRILRAYGAEPAWRITWSALGIAIAATLVLAGSLSVLSGFDLLVLLGDRAQLKSNAVSYAGIGALTLLATTGIGLLTWEWMAYQTRPRPDPTSPSTL